jgi:uncharacterized protein (DUF1501 family)
MTTPKVRHADALCRRRQLLALPWAALLGSSSWARAAQPAIGPEGGRIVLVFLRGAMDGLSAFVPHADNHYRQLRAGIAIPAPDGTANTALALDATFALHPALAPLFPLWKQGVLSFVPAAGLPQPNRSHFDAQHVWETGVVEANRAGPGWLNTWAHAGSVDRGAGTPTPFALGVGENNPEILRGPSRVKLVPQGKAALSAGALASDRTRRSLQDLYAGDTQLAQVFAQGASSRIETAQQLSQASDDMKSEMAGGLKAEMLNANNRAGNVAGLALDAQHLATLMNQDPNLRIGFLSAGGWDTHAAQGNVKGSLANSLGKLAQALVTLRQGFSRPNDVVVVVSEFGRTCAENGTGGTDHGYGNAMWLMGERVNGGRWHGRWEGLAPDRINENRDLPAFHDFRAVLSLVLRTTQGATDAQLAALFPNNPFAGGELMAGDNRALRSLFRT